MPWIPQTAAELLTALADGTLPHESVVYEYKAQLPPSAKNQDIAVDVSAMTVDGGVIIYGVSENKQRVTFSPSPIALAGVLERVSNTVSANVNERPTFDVRLLPLVDDPSNGFVVVEIPASPRAPHMVEVNNEYRYYGRVPGGNVKLTEHEVSRLYDRRRHTEDQSRLVLDAAIDAAPLRAEPLARGDLHLVARPVLADDGIRRRAFDDDDGSGLQQAVISVHNSMRFGWEWHPELADILQGGGRERTLDGVALTNYPSRGTDGEPLHEYFARLEFQDSGLLRYFRAAIAMETSFTNTGGQVHYALRDGAASQIAAQFARLSGDVLRRAQYQGLVDVYVAVLGAQGAISLSWAFRGGGIFPTPAGVSELSTDDYRNAARASVEELLDDAAGVSARLLDRLLRTIRPTGMRDPLELA